jgi:hypothetical protein
MEWHALSRAVSARREGFFMGRILVIGTWKNGANDNLADFVGDIVGKLWRAPELMSGALIIIRFGGH